MTSGVSVFRLFLLLNSVLCLRRQRFFQRIHDVTKVTSIETKKNSLTKVLHTQIKGGLFGLRLRYLNLKFVNSLV